MVSVSLKKRIVINQYLEGDAERKRRDGNKQQKNVLLWRFARLTDLVCWRRSRREYRPKQRKMEKKKTKKNE
jgi:hypothetical protein